ncbi:ferritin family protein [Nanoarchaeota archaeon]
MTDRMLAWIRFAIGLEEKGLKFYKESLSSTKHPRGMELFEFLIKVEKGHKKVLEELMDAVTKGDEAMMQKSVEDFMALNIKLPLFEERSLEKVTGDDTTLRDMFNTAAGFEKEGIEFYLRQAKDEGNPFVKKLLLKLAADEKEHMGEIVSLGKFVFGMAISID